MRTTLATIAATLVVLTVAANALGATPHTNAPHTNARTLLLKCRNGMASLYVGTVSANTPEVPQMNQRAHAAYVKCGATNSMIRLASAHPHDSALEDAYQAYMQLALGVGDYQQYLVNVAFGHTGVGILHNAQREITHGRAMAARVLPKLT